MNISEFRLILLDYITYFVFILLFHQNNRFNCYFNSTLGFTFTTGKMNKYISSMPLPYIGHTAHVGLKTNKQTNKQNKNKKYPIILIKLRFLWMWIWGKFLKKNVILSITASMKVESKNSFAHYVTHIWLRLSSAQQMPLLPNRFLTAVSSSRRQHVSCVFSN